MGTLGRLQILIPLAALGLALLLPAPARAEDEPLIGAPFRGALPPPPGVRLDLDDDEELAAVVSRVLDGRTGLPIPGALVQCYPERLLDWLWRHDFLLAQGATDERGYAQVATDGWKDDAHWVARAPGYGPSHDYGATPPEVIYLVPAVTLSGRVLDPHGHPAVGASVECFHGCGHGPTVAGTTTDGQGHFTLPGLNPNEGRLWIEGEGIQSDYHDLRQLMQYGDRLHDIETEPGHTAVGRVVDARGEPLAGVVLRSTQTHRGPSTTTDADGRFRLLGVEPNHSLQVHHPASLRHEGSGAPATDQFYEDWLPGVERTLRLSPMNLLPPPLATAGLAPRFVAPAGWTPPDEEETFEFGFHLVCLDRGAVRDGLCNAAGSVENELPAGRWQVRPYFDGYDGPAELSFDPFEVQLTAGATARPEIRLHRRPQLVIDGLPRLWQLLDLVVGDTRHRENRDGGVAWSPFVPPEGPVTIRLITRDEPPMQYFHAGPITQNGTRHVTIRMPVANRIRVFGAGPEFGRVSLRRHGCPDDQQLEHDEPSENGTEETFITWATGPLVVRVDGKDGSHRIPIELPATGGAVIDVDPRTVVATPDPESDPALDGRDVSVITLRTADGRAPAETTFERFHVDDAYVERGVGDLNDALVLRPGTWARVSRPGWRTLHVAADTPGPREVRWGDATLTLRLLWMGDPNDEPTTVWVDDHAYASTDGVFELKGLAAGRHDVIIVPYDVTSSPRDDDNERDVTGRRLQVALAAGQTKHVTVELWPEDD